MQWDWAGGGNQQWRLAWVAPGVFEVVARHSGKLLEVSGRSTADGAPVTQWADLNLSNQRWRLIQGCPHVTGSPGPVCLQVCKHRREAGNMAGRDSADFDTFYIATVRRVVLYLYAACGDRSDAQDIAQEAFARAWQHWPKVRRIRRPGGLGAHGRLAADDQPVARSAALAGRPGPDGATDRGDRRSVAGPGRHHRRAAAAADAAAAGHRPALPAGHAGPARSPRPIGVPEGTVKARLSRARTALGRLLDEEDQEFSDVTFRA